MIHIYVPAPPKGEGVGGTDAVRVAVVGVVFVRLRVTGPMRACVAQGFDGGRGEAPFYLSTSL